MNHNPQRLNTLLETFLQALLEWAKPESMLHNPPRTPLLTDAATDAAYDYFVAVTQALEDAPTDPTRPSFTTLCNLTFTPRVLYRVRMDWASHTGSIMALTINASGSTMLTFRLSSSVNDRIAVVGNMHRDAASTVSALRKALVGFHADGWAAAALYPKSIEVKKSRTDCYVRHCY